MEVHPPHKPIHNVKEFFLHLFTITIGLLIAVGIEGIVEWRHHEHLVTEAKELLRTEAEANAVRLKKELPVLTQEREIIKKSLDSLKTVQEHPALEKQMVDVKIDYSVFELQDTAWRTAQSTGALGFMPYSEAQRYVGMYRAQERALAAQEKLLEDQAAIVALLEKYDVAGEKRLSAEQASGIAEVYGRWRMHLLYIDLWAKLCAAEYEAFLAGKPEPQEMSEKL